MDFRALTRAWVLAHADEAAFARLEQFVAMVLTAAQSFNLTAWDEAAVWEKGVYTSLVGLHHAVQTGEGFHLADVGAGAGFPSVPYHIVFPAAQITLIEATQKRCDFLRTVKKTLRLRFEVIHARAEAVAGDQFDVVTAMAVAPFNQLLAYTYHLGRRGAQYVFFKGVNVQSELLAASATMQSLSIKPTLATPSAVELAGRLVLVMFAKTAPTPPPGFF